MPVNAKAVVAFSGARDQYQLPIALHEEGLLQSLVTDFYWPLDSYPSTLLRKLIPENILSARYSEALPSRHVVVSQKALTLSLVSRLHRTPQRTRKKDRYLGIRANQIALETGASVFSTNYYAYEAFSAQGLPAYRFLFSLQADPLVLKRLLLEEIGLTPAGRYSLENEIEMSIESKDFQRIQAEAVMANGWVTTSSFAAKTLMEQGVPRAKIHIVPYGVNTQVFKPCNDNCRKAREGTLRVVFVGQLIQRKGLSYLLQAARTINSKNLKLLFYTRGTVDHELLRSFSDVDFEIIYGLYGHTLVSELNQADVFILPSIAEGFGLVILEAMACGLPIITTPHSCGPDVMVDGQHGFIVPIRNSEVIAEKLEWAMHNRAALHEMGNLAAAQACQFTWHNFRSKIRQAYHQMLADVDANTL